MSTIRLRYNGPLRDGRKVVPLPVPFVSMSDKTGEVVCDPVGEFPRDDGLRLLDLCGDAFTVVGEADPRELPQEEDLDTPGDERVLPTDRAIEAHRTLKVARLRAGKLKLEVRENRIDPADPDKPFELWAPSPAQPEGAATAHPADEAKGTKVANG